MFGSIVNAVECQHLRPRVKVNINRTGNYDVQIFCYHVIFSRYVCNLNDVADVLRSNLIRLHLENIDVEYNR